MSGAALLDRVINWPSPTALFVTLGAAVALIVIAAVLLSLGKLRTFARGLGVVGLVLILLVLVLVHEQKITQHQSVRVLVTTSRYSERIRSLAAGALVGLPSAALLVMLVVLAESRRRLRAGVPSHLKVGRKYLVQKEFDAALREFNEAIDTAPDRGEAYFRRGCVYQATGQNALALADFDQAIERDPQLAAAYLHRAEARTASGDYDGALADFGQLMLLQADDADCYLNRGICLMKKGLRNDAIADFHRVLKLTNHSDFADPAKNYLHQLEGQETSPAAASNVNGPIAPPRSAPAKPQDHFL
jgi:tetratricopeptide (TPR) repeat protein